MCDVLCAILLLFFFKAISRHAFSDKALSLSHCLFAFLFWYMALFLRFLLSLLFHRCVHFFFFCFTWSNWQPSCSRLTLWSYYKYKLLPLHWTLDKSWRHLFSMTCSIVCFISFGHLIVDGVSVWKWNHLKLKSNAKWKIFLLARIQAICRQMYKPFCRSAIQLYTINGNELQILGCKKINKGATFWLGLKSETKMFSGR